MPDDRTNETLVRLARVGAGLAAGWLVHKIVDALWRRATGHTTPTPDDDEQPLVEVAIATALTGALVALTRLLTARGTARLLSR